jgi:hypothetical protein
LASGRFLLHTGGRVGVSDGGPFLEIASSVPQLIESHAVMDSVSSWDPLPGSLEPWAGSRSGTELLDRIEGLAPVPEASGRFDRWALSDAVAVREFWNWTSQRPRQRMAMIWTLGEAGRDQVARLAVR